MISLTVFLCLVAEVTFKTHKGVPVLRTGNTNKNDKKAEKEQIFLTARNYFLQRFLVTAKMGPKMGKEKKRTEKIRLLSTWIMQSWPMHTKTLESKAALEE